MLTPPHLPILRSSLSCRELSVEPVNTPKISTRLLDGTRVPAAARAPNNTRASGSAQMQQNKVDTLRQLRVRTLPHALVPKKQSKTI